MSWDPSNWHQSQGAAIPLWADLKQTLLCHHRQRAGAGVWPCTLGAGWWCLSWEHCSTTPLPCSVLLLSFPHQSRSCPISSLLPTKRETKGGSLQKLQREIWGLVYYMLNRALNYWWLLPSLTAFLKRETWANKHVSWKSPYSDRSWQEKKHPGFMTVYY